ncbi:MAG: hypothetical protein EP329_10235 [Deltaproteobacteria bacterium]|nr:MAG: hypothetical protein EP329_10235 [Deltaproteobacteria bacterium]
MAALSAALLLGCADGGEPLDTTTTPEGPGLTIAAAVGDTDFFDIELDLGVAFCSTAVGCPTSVGGTTKPSLVTGATCSMATNWDGFLLYARRLACYTGGTLATPSTWTGESVITAPATTTEERAYSAVIASNDTEYVNSTQYLEPLETGSPNHCYYEAEALVVPTALDANPRAVYHRQFPARMTWAVVIEPTGSSTFDCHFSGSPALSGVDVDYPTSVTVSLPSDTDKGDYPATFDYATISPLTMNDGADFGAARIRYVLAATMPVTPTGIPSWSERDLWVKDGANALDADIDATCARVNSSTGALVAIGVLLRDATDGSLFGLVEVLSDNSGTRFDCVREVDGSCSFISYTSGAGGEAACGEVVLRCHDGSQNYTETGVDCGGDCPGCTSGLGCSTDADCLSGYCDGGTSLCVAQTSCLALYTARTSTPSGMYELDPDGAGGAAPFMAYCDMTSGDAGWTLVMKLSTNTQNLTYGDAEWTGTGLLNAAGPRPNTLFETSTDAKYPAYNTVTGSGLRLDWIGVSTGDWTYTLGGGETTALSVFSGSENLIAGDETYDACNSALLSSAANYDGTHMKFTQGAQFYGINGDNGATTPLNLRWGFGSNDEVDGTPSANGEAWEPLVGVGGPNDSIFWTTASDAYANCGDYGSGATTYTNLAGNLWIK